MKGLTLGVAAVALLALGAGGREGTPTDDR